MDTGSLKPGDLVEVDKRGRRFHSEFRRRLGVGAELAGGSLVIAPLQKGVSYRQATSREIVGIWHANKQTRARKDSCAA
jgi:hypothetical protein